MTRTWQDGEVVKRFQRVPELILGFDTETTGLSVASDRAIAYGFCAYRFGGLVWSEQFFVVPDRPISPGAQAVHGILLEDIEARRVSGHVYSIEAGLEQAVGILRDYHERGAYVLGANIARFDLEMLRRSAISVLSRELNDDEFDISQLRIIDVIDHDLAMEPSRELRPRRGQEYLCRHYGVAPGHHDAMGDARAAVEIFLEQVIHNNAGQAPFDLMASPDELPRIVRS